MNIELRNMKYTMINKYVIYLVMFVCTAVPVFRQQYGYADETLAWEDCVTIAEQNHPDLQKAKAQIDKSRAVKGSTTSGYLPQVSINAGVERGEKTYSSGDFGTNSGVEKNTYSYGISGNQLIFDGMKSVYDIKSSGSALQEARFQYMAVSSAVRYNLRIAFIMVLKAQEEKRILEDIVEIRKKNYEFVQMRYKAGREHMGALLKSRANLLNAEFEKKRAERNHAVYRKQLAVRMGMKKGPMLDVNGVIAIGEKMENRPDFESVVKSNPNLLALTMQREAAEYSAKAALSGLSPQINAYGSYGKSDSSWPPENTQWYVGVKATYPLFEGGNSYYKYKKAAAEEKAAAAGLVSTENDLVLSLEQKWNDLENKNQLIAVRKEFLKAAEERSKIASSQYNLGLVMYDNWIIIEDELVNTKKQLLEARTDAMAAEAEWLYARGVTLKDGNQE